MGSRYVQAMHPAARSGYLYLLAAQWQSDDCMVPSDEEELAALSGLGVLWGEFSRVILRHFPAVDDGKLRNDVCFEEWSEAKRIFDSRRQAANTTNSRSPHGHRTMRKRSPVRSADTRTVTETVTETEEPVSEAKASSPRTDSGKTDPIEAIYQAYPRKVGRRAAVKAISRAIQHIVARGKPIRDAQVWLYHRVQTYARSPAGMDGEFTPHPATWFNQGRYDDADSEWQRGVNARGNEVTDTPIGDLIRQRREQARLADGNVVDGLGPAKVEPGSKAVVH